VYLRVERRVPLIHLVGVPSRRVGLPDLDQRLGHRLPVFIEHSPGDDDALPGGHGGVLAREIVIQRTDPSGPEHRAAQFGQRLRNDDQRLRWMAERRGAVGG
jgi:hypothetical protein